MNENDKRLIEDYLPILDIGEGCELEEGFKKSRFGRPYGHPHQIHKWWATRPLVACRAAVYGALVDSPALPMSTSAEEIQRSRIKTAEFVSRLCTFPGDPQTISEANNHVLEAHANRLSRELNKRVKVDDISSGHAPRPRVLDMFAGGGSIPLEALRLGCDAHAMDLNPVAHIIELCTLVYPQKFGSAEKSIRGCDADGSWAGLNEEVRHWGGRVLQRMEQQLREFYTPFPDPALKSGQGQERIEFGPDSDRIPDGFLIPIAYLWSRIVSCKNPTCRAAVPLVKQTWLCKKEGRYIALKVSPREGIRGVRFEIVESATPAGLGFDPEAGSDGGNASCLFCGAVADNSYVKEQGCSGNLGAQLMAVVSVRPRKKGKVYVSADYAAKFLPSLAEARSRLEELCKSAGVELPHEEIEARMTGGICIPYGLDNFGKLFTERQLLALATCVVCIRRVIEELLAGYDRDRAVAIVTYLGMWLDTFADYSSSLCRWKSTTQQLIQTFGRQALAMVWDFPEPNPFGGASGSLNEILEKIVAVIKRIDGRAGTVVRGSATSLPWQDAFFDAVVTDPPYYDNVDYAKLSDFFYVWLKRVIAPFCPEHFASDTTPKKNEAVADPVRYGGSKDKARVGYESLMEQSFREANRVLKPGGAMVVVYAHKTTLGWTTLVDALRQSGFTVTEAWPLDTEMKSRLVAKDTAALASSIFLVARKRQGQQTGFYDEEVRPELNGIVQERVRALWEMGISGADLVIACIGAGLRAFTKYRSVQYANGEDVPAHRFLAEVESVVLDAILVRLSKVATTENTTYSLAGVDPATRFYILWRYTYRSAELEAGEAIIFANGTHVELDGIKGLSGGSRALVEKKKSKYRLLDYTERGDDARLGMPSEDAQPAPIVDALHRTLWLMEHRPSGIPDFLKEARPSLDQMRLVAQALLGPALKGGELSEVSPTGELGALAKLTANWKSVVEDTSEAPLFNLARRGQG